MAYLEFIHNLVETMDKYFENVCELDIMYNIEKAHYILDEMIMNGQIVETNKTLVLAPLFVLDKVQEWTVFDANLADGNETHHRTIWLYIVSFCSTKGLEIKIIISSSYLRISLKNQPINKVNSLKYKNINFLDLLIEMLVHVLFLWPYKDKCTID